MGDKVDKATSDSVRSKGKEDVAKKPVVPAPPVPVKPKVGGFRFPKK